MTTSGPRIACFVSSHGFGHAARASAIMEAVTDKNPSTGFDIFTTTPEWFFQESLSQTFSYHFVQTDVGLAQTTPFHTDLILTMEQLNRFYPFQDRLVSGLVRRLKDNEITMVICDISPLGIETARQAGIPSVLIENFTWDWIYEEYERSFPPIKTHIQYLKTLFQSADFHIQTEPVGFRQNADLTAMPAGRKPKNTRAVIRNRLGIQPDDNMILITTGGIKQQLDFSEKLKKQKKITFVIPGGGNHFEISGNIIRFSHHSEFYHPDLVNAADAVVGKAGYSTIAEAYHARIPFGYVSRPDFRESDRLAEFIQQEMTGLPIPEPEFQDGSWVDRIEELLALTVSRQTAPNGADTIADFLLRLI
ncbi:MAG: hypothetical protein C4522_08485 [Desulfobacteraceae bacterium]|nr:MAG: hypothetical protein C4522_08485 [Desulfobacteraceae bacterium]